MTEWARRLENAGVFGDPDEENRQLSWYRAHRKRLYRNVGIRNCERALEAGCGTGGLTEELDGRVRGFAVGIDIRPGALAFAKDNRRGKYLTAEASAVPFADGVFDLVAFAFTVIWLADPGLAFAEARRVLVDGGRLIAFAEPDYYTLTDEPAYASTKREVIDALKGAGADPGAGAKLAEYALAARFKNIEPGVLKTGWTNARLADEEEAEMDALRRLLAGNVPAGRLEEIARARRRAINEGNRRYVLPLHYLTATK